MKESRSQDLGLPYQGGDGGGALRLMTGFGVEESARIFLGSGVVTRMQINDNSEKA